MERLFQPLKSHDHVALAVSGGPDSVALLRLAAAWNGGPKLSVLTVDHGWRPDSAREAAQVETWARELGLEAHVLALTGPKPTTSVQAAAREGTLPPDGRMVRRQRRSAHRHGAHTR